MGWFCLAIESWLLLKESELAQGVSRQKELCILAHVRLVWHETKVMKCMLGERAFGKKLIPPPSLLFTSSVGQPTSLGPAYTAQNVVCLPVRLRPATAPWEWCPLGQSSGLPQAACLGWVLSWVLLDSPEPNSCTLWAWGSSSRQATPRLLTTLSSGRLRFVSLLQQSKSPPTAWEAVQLLTGSSVFLPSILSPWKVAGQHTHTSSILSHPGEVLAIGGVWFPF